MLIDFMSHRNDSKSMYTGTIPLANIGRMSGDPHDQVNRLSLNTESNSTGFSFQPSNGEQIIYRLEMWANAQRDGCPAEYHWCLLFNAALWLCSNAAKMRNPLKFAGVPQTNERSQPLVGQSSPYCKDMCGRYCCLTNNKFFFRLSIRALVAKI